MSPIEKMTSPDDLTDQEWLAKTGEALYGPRWQTSLAKAVGLSQAFINLVLNAERALTSAHRAKLAKLCSNWINDATRRRQAIELIERYWRDTAERNFRPSNLKSRKP